MCCTFHVPRSPISRGLGCQLPHAGENAEHGRKKQRRVRAKAQDGTWRRIVWDGFSERVSWYRTRVVEYPPPIANVVEPPSLMLNPSFEESVKIRTGWSHSTCSSPNLMAKVDGVSFAPFGSTLTLLHLRGVVSCLTLFIFPRNQPTTHSIRDSCRS